MRVLWLNDSPGDVKDSSQQNRQLQGREMGPLKVATFNINNINKRLDNLLAWLAKTEPDVVSLQELKAEQEVIESHAFVLRPPFIFVIPECPERPVRM